MKTMSMTNKQHRLSVRSQEIKDASETAGRRCFLVCDICDCVLALSACRKHIFTYTYAES